MLAAFTYSVFCDQLRHEMVNRTKRDRERERRLKVLQQSVLVTLLSLTVMVSGTSQGVLVTRGETAKIPCPFGEGIIRNIYWYYTDASGSAPRAILTFFHDVLTVEESYANQAGLDEDNSTLILKKISVKDEGTYRCDVDREEQISVSNISTKLNVYGLAPNTLPNIRQCQQRSSNCTLTSNGPINISCGLHSVYPTTNVLLEWSPEGHVHQDSNFTISQVREDGTFDLTNMLKVSKTGSWSCTASYMSAEGMELTEASVFVTILDSKDDTESPSNLVAIIVPIPVVVAVVILVVIFVLLWRRQKRRKQGKRPYRQVENMENMELGDTGKAGIKDEKLANIAEAVQDESDFSKLGRNLGFRQFKINQVLRGNERNKDVFATTSMLFEWKKKTPAAKQIPAMVKALEKSGLENVITENFPDEAGVSDEKLTELAQNLNDEEAIEQLGINFGFRQFKVNQYLKSNKDHDNHSGTLAMLQEWKKKTPRTRQIRELVEALKNSNLDGSWNNNQ